MTVINKWDYAPEGATHHAVDGDGRGFWHAEEPYFGDEDCWWPQSTMTLGDDREYWRAAAPHSLEARPIEPDEFPTKPRPQLAQFANLMEEILKRNDHKGGWNECSALWLLAKLSEEVGELGSILAELHFPDGVTLLLTAQMVRSIREEAADIANIAMMIADNASRKLNKVESPTRPHPLEPIAVTNKADRDTPEE